MSAEHDAFTRDLESCQEVDSSQGDPHGSGPSDLPSRIGCYEIIRELGQGGFGVVYLAAQSEPVKRQVALKVIRLGLGSGPIMARFEAERQALAVLNHPGIARIFDAGMTDQGQSWFAMEFVDGKPLDQMLDELAVGFEERIRILISICEAVQHAHAKGVIHRDLKPGNIIMNRDGDQLTPRVIDFGIAKALDPDLDSKAVTEEGQFLGTPGYMSPEQTGHGGLDIDSRTDVYSLGAILHLVLLGQVPLPQQKILEAREAGGFVGVANLITSFEPVRPSVRFRLQMSSDPAAAQLIARRRGLDGTRLMRRLRGDLDWMILRCLELDRDKRYDSPAAIADDLRRHLENLPISAGPPSAVYQLSKFVRRNRALTIGGIAVLCSLVIGLVTSLALLSRAVDAEENAYQMLNALTEGVRAADPSLSGEKATVGDLYRQIASKIERGTLGNRPRDAAMLLLAFSLTSYNLNDYSASADYAGRVITLAESEGGIDDALIDEARNRLAQARLALGETTSVDLSLDFPASVPELMQAQYVAWNLGDYDLAAYYLGEIQSLLASRLEEEPGAWDAYATATEYQARLLADRGAWAEARVMLALADEVRLDHGNVEHEGLTQWDAGTQLARGAIFRAEGRFAEAEAALARAAGMYADLHQEDDRFMVNLAEAERRTAELDARWLDGEEVNLLESHPELGWMEIVLLRNRARAWARLDRMEVATRLFNEAIRVEALLDVESRHPGHTRQVLARLLDQAGRDDDAIRELKLAFEETGDELDNSDRPDLLQEHALLMAAHGQRQAALLSAERAAELRRMALPADAWPLDAASGLESYLRDPDAPGAGEAMKALVQRLRSRGGSAELVADRFQSLLLSR
ncbi:MAG: serine/threonine protein kinase [Phycisphaerales bacterium]|nr:serine/threonine protein kinase [Phycisphaerales bacterium]